MTDAWYIQVKPDLRSLANFYTLLKEKYEDAHLFITSTNSKSFCKVVTSF